jgi:hypothetical protein
MKPPIMPEIHQNFKAKDEVQMNSVTESLSYSHDKSLISESSQIDSQS